VCVSQYVLNISKSNFSGLMKGKRRGTEDFPTLKEGKED
jgi:hypothetical protein